MKSNEKGIKKGTTSKRVRSYQKNDKSLSNDIKEKKFLPVGTVVLLKGGKKRLMIIGFCITNDSESGKMWDYCGCLYPEGIIAPDQMFLFDHKQIEKIYYVGLKDDNEEKNFKIKLINAYKGNSKKTKEK